MTQIRNNTPEFYDLMGDTFLWMTLILFLLTNIHYGSFYPFEEAATKMHGDLIGFYGILGIFGLLSRLVSLIKKITQS